MDIRKEINPADGSPQLVLTCAKGVAVAFVCGTLAVVMLSFAAGVILGRATIGDTGGAPLVAAEGTPPPAAAETAPAPDSVKVAAMETYTLPANALILTLAESLEAWRDSSVPLIENVLRQRFEELEKLVEKKDSNRYVMVDLMLESAFIMARTLWMAKQS